MTAKKRGLGRGLDALLGNVTEPAEVPVAPAPAAMPTLGIPAGLAHLPVDLIQRGKYQPRRDINQEALQELANSILAQGVMQPIVVRHISPERFEIIAGERRWRATQLAGLDTIPVIIKDVSDDAAMAMALIENIQRENLNPIEESIALQRLQDEFGLTQQQVADAVGKSRAAVANLLRLLGLNEEVKTLLAVGELDMGHARALLSLDDARQVTAARQVVAKKMSVRQTEALVRKLLEATTKPQQQMAVNPDIQYLEQRLSEQLGSSVSIQQGSKGKGKLVIKYNSNDELEGILAHIK